jgi:putative inorganic carbon (hco3(-)) transporter
MLWARVSDIGIAEYALPSLAVPFALGLLGVALWLRIASLERIGLRTFRRAWPVLPYLTIVSLSAAWASDAGRSLSTAVDLAKNVLIFWVLVESISSARALKMVCLVLVLVAALLSGLSIYQQATATFTSHYAGFAQASIRQIAGTENLYRLSGPVGDPNYYALILLVVVPLGIALLRTSMPLPGRIAVILAVALTCGGVVLTYSRGGALVLVLAVGLSVIRLGKVLPVMAILLAVVPIGALLTPASVWDRFGTLANPFGDDSVELRLGAQQVALEMFLDHPFAGVGADNYPVLYQDYSRDLGVPAVASEFYPHNLYLQVAAESGAIGLLTFVPILLLPLIRLERLRRTSPAQDVSLLASGVEISLVCYLVASVALHSSYPRYLWIVLALATAAGG